MEANTRSPGGGPQAQPWPPQDQQQAQYAQSPAQPDYSTLEVATDRDPRSGPQVFYETAPEPVANGYYAPNKAPYGLPSDESPTVVGQHSPHPIVKQPTSGMYPIPVVDEAGTPAEKPKKTTAMSRKKKWIIAAIVLFVVVAAAVGGGVGGALASRNSSSSSSSSGPANDGGSASPAPSDGGAALGSSALSVVNYTVGTTDYRMAFWQPRNDSSDIVYSLWDASQGDGWKRISISSKLSDSTAVEAQPGTPIAAAARPRLGRNPGFAVSVFYLSASNVVQELRTTNPRGATWTKVTHPVTAAKSSQLSAYWDVCETNACSNLVALNYETEDHKSAWLWPGLTDNSSGKNVTTQIQVSIIPGSGIGLTAAMDPDVNNTAQQNLKLYYQDSKSLNLMEVTRTSESRYVITQTKLAPDMPESKPLQLYATSFYKASAARFLFILMRTADGTLKAMHWNSNSWRQPAEPIFRNTPTEVGKSFPAVSVTNDLKIYALARDGKSFHVFNADKNDPITWTYDSPVTLE